MPPLVSFSRPRCLLSLQNFVYTPRGICSQQHSHCPVRATLWLYPTGHFWMSLQSSHQADIGQSIVGCSIQNGNFKGCLSFLQALSKGFLTLLPLPPYYITKEKNDFFVLWGKLLKILLGLPPIKGLSSLLVGNIFIPSCLLFLVPQVPSM